MGEKEERESPRREEGERGRLEGMWAAGWVFGRGLRSGAVVVEAEEEEGEGEWFVTGRRWKAIGMGGREGEGGLYMTEPDRRGLGGESGFGTGDRPGSEEDVHIPQRNDGAMGLSPVRLGNDTALPRGHSKRAGQHAIDSSCGPDQARSHSHFLVDLPTAVME